MKLKKNQLKRTKDLKKIESNWLTRKTCDPGHETIITPYKAKKKNSNQILNQLKTEG